MKGLAFRRDDTLPASGGSSGTIVLWPVGPDMSVRALAKDNHGGQIGMATSRQSKVFTLALLIVTIAGCNLVATPLFPASTATQTPTATTAPTLTPSTTPSATPVPREEMNTSLESEQWRIVVLSAIDKGREFKESGILSNQTFTLDELNVHFVRVEVEVEALEDQPISNAIEIYVVLHDSDGNIYPRLAAGMRGSYYDFTEGGEQNIYVPLASPTNLDYLFAVADDAQDLLFAWPDMSPVRLEVTVEEE